VNKINSTIVALQLANRDFSAPEVQEILTKYGTNIETRLGLRTDDAEQGLILLQFTGDEAALDKFEDDLTNLEPVKFDSLHPNFV